MTTFRSAALLILAVLAWGDAARAQFESGSLVSGTGTVSVSRMPEMMRLQVSIMGRGATLKDALAALKDRTGKAQTQLVALGAEKGSIKVGDARIAELPNNSRQQQMQIMMMQRMQRGGKPKPKAQPAPPVLVTAQMTADWKLSSKTGEELLLAVHPVQEKIKTADLAGSKEAEKLTPEQEELLEEAEQNFGFNSSDEPKPGEPLFTFVSPVSEADRDKAFAEAFEKAKAQASRLAKAAGSQLGALKALSAVGGASDGEEMLMGYNYNSPAYRALQMARRLQATSPADEPAEAIGAEPGMVRYNVTINASFGLEPRK